MTRDEIEAQCWENFNRVAAKIMYRQWLDRQAEDQEPPPQEEDAV